MLRIVPENCVACGQCEELCPVGAIQGAGWGGEQEFGYNEDACLQCGECAEICPGGALDME